MSMFIVTNKIIYVLMTFHHDTKIKRQTNRAYDSFIKYTKMFSTLPINAHVSLKKAERSKHNLCN